MKRFSILASCVRLSGLFFLLSPTLALAEDLVCENGTVKQGVLVSTYCSNWTFWDYVNRLLGLQGIGLYVYFAAVVMIIFSGIEYMMGASGDGQKKAKERIRGILVGILFYSIALVLLRLIATV